jgi:hypothetical protein
MDYSVLLRFGSTSPTGPTLSKLTCVPPLVFMSCMMIFSAWRIVVVMVLSLFIERNSIKGTVFNYVENMSILV